MQNVHVDPYGWAWCDAAGFRNPPSAPPTIPPIVIHPFIDQIRGRIPNPAIDPRTTPPGPPIEPPRRPELRLAGRHPRRPAPPIAAHACRTR